MEMVFRRLRWWLNPRGLSRALYRARKLQPLDTYFDEIGWYASRAARRPVDATGQPLPWMTYSAIEFLAERARPHHRVFEYGAGSSTLWWAARVAEVVSVEHDASWVAALSVPEGVRLLHEERGSTGYVEAAAKGVYDIVVIDGRDRVRCAPYALKALAPGGVIVWDNSERADYEPGLAVLAEAGMRRLRLSGLGPINAYPWETSILYRDDNCLGL